MTLTTPQRTALKHLRAAYFGPEGGAEEVLMNRPHLQYSVGMLFPAESTSGQPPLPGEGTEFLTNAVEEGDVEESDANVPLAEDWRPSSVAISFVVDSPSVVCHVAGATYKSATDDGPPRWQRRPFSYDGLILSEKGRIQQLAADDVPFEIGSRWRGYGSAFLVTVHVRLTSTSTGDDKLDISQMVFQIELAVETPEGGRILEYDTSRAFDADSESAELRLRYRNRKVYAVGHGMAADWTIETGECTRVFLTPVPAFVVPTVETTGFTEGTDEWCALELSQLSRIDTETEHVISLLDSFVRAFSQWVEQQEARVPSFEHQAGLARTLVDRSRLAVERMKAGVDLLRDPAQSTLRTSFALGMAAMRLQMHQSRINHGQDPPPEPRWRPFQLGFLLISLASTVDERHKDRELVDLIWFPTGGGKTEAYLGLAAIEIFHRRLQFGIQGGGTAVITRYTLRLLTAQQFQRAAALVCAMELLRSSDPRADGLAPFSIGLWVGNDVTPASLGEATESLERLHKAARPEEANSFQVESCPWCQTSMVPLKHTDDRAKYGFRREGHDLVIHCTNTNCEFHDELPLSVVDDVLYERPPTILLATVDKFARLQFKPEAGKLLGLNTPFRQPSIIIQDELHLLSGPLGTTVGVFDAVIQLLLSKSGSSPKIIASTATIRASAEQVRGLYGRDVALYPPAGLDDDRTFFSRPAESGEGRLYVGLMPQSVSQASALVAAASPLVELPCLIGGPESGPSRDSYWTLVMYHNSLRELGRSSTLAVDDVNGRLETRSERLNLPLRRVRAGRVLELTSRRGPGELPNDLRELGVGVDKSDEAIDVVLSSNMLSVGIDIPRLALMLMVGQPKTTAEYIQATSRVGRGENNGIVVTLFRSNRARDRSHFETFRSYHEALYRSVEPTSVTPWSLSSRDRSLAGALVALLRQSFTTMAVDSSAKALDLSDNRMSEAIDTLTALFLGYVTRSDPAEDEATTEQLGKLLRDWDLRASSARKENVPFTYDRRRQADNSLLKRFGQAGEGWLVGDSMRSVEENVAIEVKEPMEEVHRAADQA
ncbi:helicase-related protein [Mycolicibacterium sp. 050232]|uniref:helicase-related protein n=1 Tax=Mycolicibacterium sp. 050232 TaxID=3113982 RepID=UPI002E28A54D|nr:helicase-related protein [Mycolicibacterium sp. 050232]MED5812896.1 helicase-related protein [Mycolicibacterium sp. 050232]